MLEEYFCAPKTLARLRTGLSGPYIDGFADALEQDGYSRVQRSKVFARCGPPRVFPAGQWQYLGRHRREYAGSFPLPSATLSLFVRERRKGQPPCVLWGEVLSCLSVW